MDQTFRNQGLLLLKSFSVARQWRSSLSRSICTRCSDIIELCTYWRYVQCEQGTSDSTKIWKLLCQHYSQTAYFDWRIIPRTTVCKHA